MAKKKRGKHRTRSKRKASSERTVRATYANGRVEVNPDDGRYYPAGTMLVWDAETPRGKEMRWTVTGGGWPFDD